LTLIIDASVAIKWFIDENLEANARHIIVYHRDLQAPDFIVTEVANIVWKKHSRGEIDDSLAQSIVSALPEYFTQFTPTIDLNERALELALELDHPIYDCLYLACAERHEGPVITADKRFFNKLQSTPYKDQAKFLNDLNLMLPLYVSVTEIAKIILAAENYGKTHHNIHTELTNGKEFGIVNTNNLKPALDSPASRTLNLTIENLTENEQKDILALGWLGQGYSGDNWAEIRDRTETYHLDKNNIQYVCSLTCYLKDGLAKLRSLQ
jgi:predicted nucleic acid-binding protein